MTMKIVSCLRSEGVLYTVLRAFEKFCFALGLLPKERRLISDCSQLLQERVVLNDQLVRMESENAEVRSQIARLNRELSEALARFERVYWSWLDFVNPELAVLKLSKSKKNILLVGYYGAYNLGDEMMRQAILNELAEYDDVHVTIMLAANPEYEAVDLGGVDIIHYCRTNSDYSHLSSRFDALVIGGGALLNEQWYLNECAHDFKSLGTIVVELPRYFVAKRKPVICLGLSTGPQITNSLYKNRIQYLVKNALYFNVRDKYSFAVLSDADVLREKMVCTDDLVLSDRTWLTTPQDSRVGDQVVNIGIVWVSVLPDVRAILPSVIEAICQRCNAKPICVKIFLIPFYHHQSCDARFYTTVVEGLPLNLRRQVEIVNYPYDLKGVISIFEKLDVMLNLRYHAALICGALGIPQLVGRFEHSDYTNKMRWIVDEFKCRTRELNVFEDPTNMADVVLNVLGLGKGERLDRHRFTENNHWLKGAIETLYKEITCTTT